MELTKKDHFSGGANITPTADASKPDLADIIREIQTDVNAVVGDYVSIALADSPFSISSQRVIGIDTTADEIVLNLPSAASVRAGTTVMIKDEAGNCTTNVATINAVGDDLIDDSEFTVLAVDWAHVKFYSNGVDRWFSYNAQ